MKITDPMMAFIMLKSRYMKTIKEIMVSVIVSLLILLMSWSFLKYETSW
jgi:hypothetical protein